MSEDREYFSPHAIEARSQARRQEKIDTPVRAAVRFYQDHFGGLGKKDSDK